MTKIDELTNLGIIGDIRQRLGADDENDTSIDDEIENTDNKHLVSAYSGWYLGSNEFA